MDLQQSPMSLDKELCNNSETKNSNNVTMKQADSQNVISPVTL